MFGATVTIEEVESGDEQVYQIVGETEGNLELNRISVISPVARALIGREIGDEVKLPGRAGPRVFEIVDVIFK